MTDAHTSSSTSSTITDALRLPLASLPMAVLPGSVVTLPLASEQLRVAVTAARRATDPRVVLRVGDDDALGVLAQVPDVGSLPSGDPAAIVRIDGRVRLLAVHHSEREGDFADVEPIADPRPTPRIEALARELRAVLGVIAELRNSRRLPELLRAAPAPGALADGVAAWADLDDAARAERARRGRRRRARPAGARLGAQPRRRAAGGAVDPQRRHRGRRPSAARVPAPPAARGDPQGAR